jgi:hypothetical protein
MSKASLVALCRSAALAGALGASLLGCRKDEPPPPLPAAPKAPEPVAAAEPLQLKAEDAGKPPEPAAAPKATGSKASGGSLAKCCAALRQNAVSAPEPNKTYMTTAATVCDGAAALGKDKSSVVSQLQTALRGAGMPADCK